jgi:hypothetical protein
LSLMWPLFPRLSQIGFLTSHWAFIMMNVHHNKHRGSGRIHFRQLLLTSLQMVYICITYFKNYNPFRSLDKTIFI